MVITKEMINRINELARKQKNIGLNAAEKDEQTKLRQKYIEYIKGQVRSNLEQVRKTTPSCSDHAHGNCNCHKH